jgi:hypothetical protein
MVALALAGCATIRDEQAAISRGCRAIKARFGQSAVRCPDLRARMSTDGAQWVVMEAVPAETLHAAGAVISRKSGRVHNVWRD